MEKDVIQRKSVCPAIGRALYSGVILGKLGGKADYIDNTNRMLSIILLFVADCVRYPDV